MKLRLQTDLALRLLLFLSYVRRKTTIDEVAEAYGISRDHLVKVAQQLARLGFVRTQSGRGGGILLSVDPDDTTIGSVVAAVEGRQGVLECVEAPEVCPLEPGCGLRRLLMSAEDAFYQTLESKTLGDFAGSRARGGLQNLGLVRGED
ncbi:MAG: Rrf2 family transcriptional regulator [Planctomycetota bacterium]